MMKIVMFINKWLNPYYMLFDLTVGEYARKNPEEFDSIIRSLYLDKIVDWMSKKLKR